MRSAVAAADAGRLVRRALSSGSPSPLLKDAVVVDVIAAGKASAAMLRAFADVSGAAIRQAVAVGLGEPGALPEGTQWHPGRHPIPDGSSVVAARAALDLARHASGCDLVAVLLSGGASSLMAVPAAGVSLGDKQVTIGRLLSKGADIRDLNIVRKHLSDIKGGRLAAASRVPMVTLAVSDVFGDDLSLIGSGPTVADPSSFEMAEDVLNRHGGLGTYPRDVGAFLARGRAGSIAESPKPGDPSLARSVAHVIGGRADALDGAARSARSMGYHVRIVDTAVQGEARLAAAGYLTMARGLIAAAPRPLCLLSAGETTVHVTGAGRGGRNQEFALALAAGLETLGQTAAVASVGTDGIDGPTDAAGALVDSTTVTRARQAGLDDPRCYLDDNNSYDFFSGLGDLIRTGPTDTNVGDIQILLIAA